MDQDSPVRRMLDLAGSSAPFECRQLILSFRKALMDANPDLTAEMMATYDEAISREIPSLIEAVRQAHIAVATKTLNESQLDAWGRLAALPETQIFFESLRSLGSAFQASNKEVFRSEGAAAHVRSAEKLFESL